MVKTVAAILEIYSGFVSITINDRDFDIVARNVVILLVAIVVEDIDKAVDCMIYIWYLALIRSTDLDLL